MQHVVWCFLPLKATLRKIEKRIMLAPYHELSLIDRKTCNLFISVMTDGCLGGKMMKSFNDFDISCIIRRVRCQQGQTAPGQCVLPKTQVEQVQFSVVFENTGTEI